VQAATDPEAFTSAAETHRRELEVYCYRMTGSFSEAEDLAQETFERAWRARDRYDAASSMRAWLYKIATNLCIDHLRRTGRRRVLPFDVMDPIRGPADIPLSTGEHHWLEPFPDRLLSGQGSDPDEEVVHRETLELAFLAAVQHLPLLQRAVFIARDVMGWSAKATAVLLDTSQAAVKSALQRARATIREHLPQRREEWAATTSLSQAERDVVQRYINAHEGGTETLAEVLADDLRIAYPGIPLWSDSREAFIEASREHALPGDYRFVATSANLQPAVAIYRRAPEETAFRLVALELLRIRDDKVVEIVDFDPRGLSPSFGLAEKLG
jgi:RNA polymerase sigma-70 factor, ECF subfamily